MRLAVLTMSCCALLTAAGGSVAMAQTVSDPVSGGVQVDVTQATGVARHRPRGLMVTVHGGGWYLTGAPVMQTEAANVRRFNNLGWRVANIDYLPGGKSVNSAVAVYDWSVAHYGKSLPICVEGSSAGGHLALLIAARRPKVACVIGNAAPTDLNTLPERVRQHLVIPAFGSGDLSALNPNTYASRIHAQVLLGATTSDPYIPAAQSVQFARLDRRAHAEIMPPGDVLYVHSNTTHTALRRYGMLQQRLLLAAGRRPRHTAAQ